MVHSVRWLVVVLPLLAAGCGAGRGGPAAAHPAGGSGVLLALVCDDAVTCDDALARPLEAALTRAGARPLSPRPDEATARALDRDLPAALEVARRAGAERVVFVRIEAHAERRDEGPFVTRASAETRTVATTDGALLRRWRSPIGRGGDLSRDVAVRQALDPVLAALAAELGARP